MRRKAEYLGRRRGVFRTEILVTNSKKGSLPIGNFKHSHNTGDCEMNCGDRERK